MRRFLMGCDESGLCQITVFWAMLMGRMLESALSESVGKMEAHVNGFEHDGQCMHGFL